VSLKIRRTEDEVGSAARGGEDKKILKGVESHRKIEARCFTVHLHYKAEPGKTVPKIGLLLSKRFSPTRPLR
jgi:hypothetical protein